MCSISGVTSAACTRLVDILLRSRIIARTSFSAPGGGSPRRRSLSLEARSRVSGSADRVGTGCQELLIVRQLHLSIQPLRIEAGQQLFCGPPGSNEGTRRVCRCLLTPESRSGARQRSSGDTSYHSILHTGRHLPCRLKPQHGTLRHLLRILCIYTYVKVCTQLVHQFIQRNTT